MAKAKKSVDKSRGRAKTAYKFRAPAPFERIADILLKKRLYCAHYNELNDLSEAHYLLSKDGWPSCRDRESFVRGLKSRKSSNRISSLCGVYDSPLMWAHYADGFEGVAIEVKARQTFRVRYVAKLPSVLQPNARRPMDCDAVLKRILSRKLRIWEPEGEVRLLNRRHFVDVVVQRVIVGPRASEAFVSALRAICAVAKVGVAFAKVTRGKIEVTDDDGCEETRR